MSGALLLLLCAVPFRIHVDVFFAVCAQRLLLLLAGINIAGPFSINIEGIAPQHRILGVRWGAFRRGAFAILGESPFHEPVVQLSTTGVGFELV